MIARPYDRVQDTTTSTGTGGVVLDNAPPTGMQAFAARYTVGDLVPYTIQDQASGLWEVGICQLVTTNSISRSAVNVLDGSSGKGVLVNFTAGTKGVFATLPAQHVANLLRSCGIQAAMAGRYFFG